MILSENLFRIIGVPIESGPVPLETIAEQISPGHAVAVREKYKSIIDSKQPADFLAEFHSPNGQLCVRRSMVAPEFDRSGNVVRLVGVTQDVSAQKMAERQLRTLSHRLLTLRNDEQRRMARNLHETVSQTITALKMTLGNLLHIVPEPSLEILEGLSTARDLADEALREVRAVSALLYPPLLEEIGLIAAIRGYTFTLSERIGTTIRVDIPSELPRMPREIEVTLFRVVQESLTNIHRHSKASSCTIRIRRTADSVELEVRDNGIGMQSIPDSTSPESSDVHVGIGLAGMRDRVRQLEGLFRVDSAVGRGTAVYVEIPLDSPAPIPETLEVAP